MPSMLKHVLANWLGLAVVGAVSFALTPVLIHGFGELGFGMWMLAASVLDYYGLLDLGMRWTAFRFVSRLKGTEDEALLAGTFVTAFFITVALGFSVGIVAPPLAYFLPEFFDLTGGDRASFQVLIILFLLRGAVSFPLHLVGAALRGLQRFDLVNLELITSSVLRAVLLVSLVRSGYGVREAAAAVLGLTVFSLLLQLFFLRRAEPRISLHPAHFRWAHAKELLGFSAYLLVNRVGEYLRFNGGLFIVGKALGVALVTPFSVATRLMTYFRLVMGAVNGPIMARLSELDSQGRTEELRALFLETTKATTLVSLFLGAVIALNGADLIRLWVGESLMSAFLVALVLVVGQVVSSAQHPALLFVFSRAEHHRSLAAWTLAEGILGVVLGVAGAYAYGLVGVAAGATIPTIVLKAVIQPWYALRPLALSSSLYFKSTLVRPLMTTVVFLLASWELRPLGSSGWLGLVTCLVIEGAAFALLAYIVGLTAEERRKVDLAVKRLLTHSPHPEGETG